MSLIPRDGWRQNRRLVLGAIVAMLVLPAAHAEPRYARMFKQHSGYMPSCNACHLDGGGTALNLYGEAFKAAGPGAGAFAAIADSDSDLDGFANAQEIAAKANPGSAKSTPKKPGDWLSTANLIPREVQKLFPGVTTYKPLDTILTETEIQRAKAHGVALGPDDETTIYIPVADGKPAGTAIIVPAQFGDRQFFLLLATDRKLTVTHALPIHASKIDGAQDASLYQSAIALPVEQLPQGGQDGSLENAVRRGLKKAGTLLLVRLKKAG